MALQASSLTIVVGRSLPLGDSSLVFASTDEHGTPGVLNSWVLEQLGLGPSELLNVRKDLSSGRALIRGNSGQTLALVVTVGKQKSNELLGRNLSAVFREGAKSSDVTHAPSVWMPLMGVGAGGLSFVESLEITLGAIMDGYAHGLLMWRDLRLSLGSEIDRAAVDILVDRTRKFFEGGPVSVTVGGDQESDPDGPSSNKKVEDSGPEAAAEAVQRGYSDNLQTQVDAPPELPGLRFPAIAKSIVDVVEETVRSDDKS